MTNDPFKGHEAISTQSQRWVTVVPSDGDDLAVQPKALYFNSGGNVALMGDDGHSEVLTVVAQQTLDVRPTRVLVTGTTVAAGGIIALN